MPSIASTARVRKAAPRKNRMQEQNKRRDFDR
jgi:hypothetical protein